MYCPPNAPKRGCRSSIFLVTTPLVSAGVVVASRRSGCRRARPPSLMPVISSQNERAASTRPAVVAGCACLRRSTSLLPITTPSASSPTSIKWSRVDTPKPTASGALVAVRILDIMSLSDDDTLADAPVVPSFDTTYMNESASVDRYRTRSRSVVGAMSGTNAICSLRHTPKNVSASSGGRSTTMNPFTPASRASRTARSSPYAIMGL